MSKQYPDDAYEADICLFLEGTYPYVSGGVSSWVHMLINEMKEFTFSILLMMPDKQPRKLKYEVPENVVKIRIMYLQDKSMFRKPIRRKDFSAGDMKMIQKFHMAMPFVDEANDDMTSGKDEFEQMTQKIAHKRWHPSTILYSKRSWKALIRLYHLRNPEVSFLDYFWTWRYLHAGIFSVMREEIPVCRMYHTVSTGYAGLLASRARVLHDRPLILTEHGIYSKERKIEISRATWIFEKSRERYNAEKKLDTFKQIWINAFRLMSRMCYDQADEIITLYGGNQRLQRDDGANSDKMKIVPNGVNYGRLSGLEREKQERPIIGFVGRVVPIKDVKTFIRAMGLVVKVIKDAEVWLMGPTDEDEEYFNECSQLVESLNLKDVIKFTGNVNLTQYYPKLDVMVLTSLSEGQPLVILEAQCLAIPVVASDVGACRELLLGRDDDSHIGPGGIVTGLADAEGTAMGVINILKDPEYASTLGEAGKKRMLEFYDMPIFFNAYRTIYEDYCNA